MENDLLLQIGFPNVSPAEASRAAADLGGQINRVLRERGLAQVARQHRTDPAAQDLGQVIQIILAAPAMIVMARGVALGIQKYLARTNRGRITITRPDGTEVEITDIESRDVSRIITALGMACH
jgi:hypothetical protein